MKIIFAVTILLCAVLFRDRIESYYNYFKEFVTQILKNEDSGRPGIFTYSQLTKYNGLDQDKLYLSVLGSVFDVTEGRRNYKKGAPYHYFIGKDGSRALVTGNFKDESEYKDHVLDLKCDEIRTLLNWKVTFREKYVPVGKLIGRYYDHNGKKTEYFKQLSNRARQCKVERELTMKENEKFPPCNIAWSAEEGSRVWCTKTSGGVSRDWVGVPRQMYTPGKDKPLCVCVNVDKVSTSALFEEYKNCSKTSTSCNLDN